MAKSNKKAEKFSIKVFHGESEKMSLSFLDDNEKKEPSIGAIHRLLNKNGYKSIIEEKEQEIKKELADYRLEIKDRIFSLRKDILVNKTDHSLVITGHVKNDSYFHLTPQIVFLYKDEKPIKSVIKSLKSSSNVGKLYSGSYSHHLKSQDITSSIDKKSPNGKIIDDREFKNNLYPVLRSEENREIISKISDNFEYAESEENIRTVLPDRLNESLQSILGNKNFFEKSARFKCKKCERVPFSTDYDSVEDAKSAQKGLNFTCPGRGCNSHQIDIVNVFKLKPDAVKANGGEWLEKQVSDILKKYTPHVWSGVMIGNDEYDNIFFSGDRVFVTENKDTSFGQTALYTLVGKARKINADIALIITTENLHNNVMERIREMNEQDSSLEIKTIIDNGDEIESKLNRVFQESQDSYRKELITN